MKIGGISCYPLATVALLPLHAHIIDSCLFLLLAEEEPFKSTNSQNSEIKSFLGKEENKVLGRSSIQRPRYFITSAGTKRDDGL